jgi:hypothetical protein
MASFAYMRDTHGGPYGRPASDPERSASCAAQLLNEATRAEHCGFDGFFVPERYARTECMFMSPHRRGDACAAPYLCAVHVGLSPSSLKGHPKCHTST